MALTMKRVAQTSRVGGVRPARVARPGLVVRAQQTPTPVQKAEALPALGAVAVAASTLLSAGSASAATELMQLAGSDNRPAILASLFLPVIGWVGFNIASGLFNQLDVMADKVVPPEQRSVRINAKKRSVMGPILGLGLLASAQSADAATELMQLAGSDNRPAILASLFLPVLGWVGFNIASGLFNQLDVMSDKVVPPEQRSVRINAKGAKKRSIMGPALGLGLLAAAQSADAAELMQLAASDNRPAILASLFLPVLGWVGFNIAGGLFNQLNVMSDKVVPPEARSVRINGAKPSKRK